MSPAAALSSFSSSACPADRGGGALNTLPAPLRQVSAAGRPDH